MIRTLLASAAVFLAGSAQAAPVGAIRVTDAWSRPAATGLPTGVAYLTLVNAGAAADRLMSASSPKADRVGLHRSVMTAGVMRMDPVPEGLELPPGRPVALKPGGYHLMLAGLKGGLKVGEAYPLTLRFAHAHAQTVTVQVRNGAEMVMR